MYTKTTVINAWPVLGATIVACMFFAGDVAAEGSTVTVAIRVSAQGIDLSEPAGARELYRRLKNAAWIACTRANRVGLEPSPDPEACSEKALGEVILSAHMPLLTRVYLETHSLGQAAAHGIDVPVAPVQVAAK
jgi:UrcA family protein